MKTWITSDHHFGHANIIKYCNRPFKDITEMDNELCSIWNSHVAPEDVVYHLGDFTLGNAKLASYYFQRLNGTIFVLGNPWHHDARWLDYDDIQHFTEFSTKSSVFVHILLPVTVLEDISMNADGNGIPAVLCHYAFEIWDRKHYGSYHFHGHSHGELQKVHNRLDVGVDSAYKLVGEYRPLELEEACKFAGSINYKEISK
jgi:calcineurin-like phosphoesterase family protein